MKRTVLFLLTVIVGSYLIFGCGAAASVSISSLSPNGGPTGGGTAVTISGRGFLTGTTVKFGDNSATVVSIASSTSMTVTAPAATSGATGSVNVTVTDASGNVATLSNGYKYASDLFVANYSSADVVTFDVNRQTPLITNSLTTSTNGTGPYSLDADTDHGILFAANERSSDVSSFLYAISSGTIALTAATGSPFTVQGTYPRSIAADKTSHFVFTANYSSNDVTSFKYDTSTGVLTFVERQAGTTSLSGPIALAVDPARMLVFIANYTGNTISVFTYDATGDLTEASNSPTGVSDLKNPHFIAIDTSIPAIFVANYGGATVTPFTYNATTAALTQVTSGNCSGSQPVTLAIDTTNKVLFVAQSSTNNIGAFTYSTSAGLTAVNTTGTGSGGTNPWGLALDVDKKYLYVANRGSADIQIFTYTTGGVLTASGSPVDAGGLSPISLFLAP